MFDFVEENTEEDVLIENQKLEILAINESCKTKADRAIMFVPSGFMIGQSESTISWSKSKALENGSLIAFSGEVLLKNADPLVYKFKTGSVVAHRFELTGHQLESAVKPSTIFKGFPKIVKVNHEDGVKSYLTQNNGNHLSVKIRPYGEGKKWEAYRPSLVGQYELAIFGEHDEILFRRMFGVVPSNFDITTKMTNNSNHQGVLTIDGVKA